MKLMFIALAIFTSQLFAANPEPETFSALLTGPVATSASNGFCEQSVACPGGQYTAYCKAEGPYTRCGKYGAYGVRCVAWNSAGKYTVASQECP